MAPVTQYVFAETLKLSIHFTAGSHEWLPYSAIPPFPKQIYKLLICLSAEITELLSMNVAAGDMKNPRFG